MLQHIHFTYEVEQADVVIISRLLVVGKQRLMLEETLGRAGCCLVGLDKMATGPDWPMLSQGDPSAARRRHEAGPEQSPFPNIKLSSVQPARTDTASQYHPRIHQQK